MRSIIAGAVALLACSSLALADVFTISPTTQENYQEYLSKLKATGSGAFAVSADGRNSYYVYCTNNGSCGAVTEALEGCRATTSLECQILAKGDEPEIEFQVASSQIALEGDSPVLSGMLGTDAIKALVVGNSQTGEYDNNVKWTEYFAPDGTITGKVEPDTEYSATYEIEDGQICYDYDGTAQDWCAKLSVADGLLYHLQEDGVTQSGPGNVVIRGNALEGATELVKLQ